MNILHTPGRLLVLNVLVHHFELLAQTPDQSDGERNGISIGPAGSLTISAAGLGCRAHLDAYPPRPWPASIPRSSLPRGRVGSIQP